MGLLILPFFLLALFLVAVSIPLTILSYVKKQLGIKEIFFGILIAGIILGLIIFWYAQCSRVGIFEGTVVFPIFMVYIPFAIAILFKIINAVIQKNTIIDKILLVSVIVSPILYFLFYDYTVNMLVTRPYSDLISII